MAENPKGSLGVEQAAWDILADSVPYDGRPTRAELEAEERDAELCRCGHTAHWHGDDGGGMGSGHCEHDGECRCERFVEEIRAVPPPADLPFTIADFETPGMDPGEEPF